MKPLFLAIGLLLSGSGAKGQAVVQIATENTAAPAYCENYRAAVRAELATMSNLPDWRIVVTCDDAMWKYLRHHDRADRTNTAFTNPKAADGRALTVLHGGAWNTTADLQRTLRHELEHIRCNCSLGE